MHFRLILPALPLLITCNLLAQINPENIDIIRDKWGVPHIYAPTDAEVAYGLAWATAEDDFKSLQETLLTIKKRGGEIYGKDGAIKDFITHLINADSVVEANYEKDLSLHFRQICESYAQGLNSFAEKNKDKIAAKKLFPVSGRDIIKGYVVSLALMTHVHYDIGKVFKNLKPYDDEPGGSNGFAISRNKTTSNETFIALNSHQPLEGPFAWYEAHLVSDEGLNILGSNFPGGVTLFSGVTPHHAWGHTLNYPDFNDVYKLEMHPEKKLFYKMDDKWYKLYERKARLKVKLGPFKIPIKKKSWWCKYGPVLKNEAGFWAFRFPAIMDIRAAEQWYYMNKANSFEEFKDATKMMALPGTNIVYADKNDHLFYLSAGLFPERNSEYDWMTCLKGNTCDNLWAPSFLPWDSLVKVEDPDCGFIFNTNNTPYNATCDENNVQGCNNYHSMGYQVKDNNRSLRFRHLIDTLDLVSWQDFLRIKYDLKYMDPVYTPPMENIEIMLNLSSESNPELSETIKILNHWNRSMDVESEGASIAILCINFIIKELVKQGRLPGENVLTEEEYIAAVKHAQDHLLKHFKTVHVPLGQLQHIKRGDISYPIGGGPDVLAAMHSSMQKDGTLKARAGESYISLIRYPKNGLPIIETINAYGTSNNPESIHYSDQMEMFVNQKRKEMTLDLEEVRRNAERIYHPE